METKYKKMIRGMVKNEKKSRRKKKDKSWMLYLLSCADGSLYTGITNNLERRLKMHQSGRASRYTRTRRPVELRYQELCGTRGEALVRECQVKAFSRQKKEKLIQSVPLDK